MNTRFATLLLAAAATAMLATGCITPAGDDEDDSAPSEMTNNMTGNTGTTTTSSSAATVIVSNQSWSYVYHLHIADCASSSWGPDLLGSSIMDPGEQGRISVTAGCRDFLAVNDEGYEWQTRYEVAGGTTLTWTLR